jgi:hypothetical protein
MVIWIDQDPASGTGTVNAALGLSGMRWGKPVTLQSGPGYPRDPQVEFDAHGNAIATWSLIGLLEAVQVASKPARGPWGRALMIDTVPGLSAMLAVNPGGTALLGWPGGTRARAIRASFGSTTGSWDRPVTVGRGGDYGFGPEVHVALDVRGDALIAWYAVLPPPQTTLINAVYRPAGRGWGKPIVYRVGAYPPPVPDPGSGDPVHLQVALDRNGDSLLVWSTGARIKAAYRPVGRGWGEPMILCGDPSDISCLSPGIGFDSRGHALAVWTRGWPNSVAQSMNFVP